MSSSDPFHNVEEVLLSAARESGVFEKDNKDARASYDDSFEPNDDNDLSDNDTKTPDPQTPRSPSKIIRLSNIRSLNHSRFNRVVQTRLPACRVSTFDWVRPNPHTLNPERGLYARIRARRTNAPSQTPPTEDERVIKRKCNHKGKTCCILTKMAIALSVFLLCMSVALTILVTSPIDHIDHIDLL